jgi:signal transduction histidine kinase/CheY-like chemotaxis protein
LIADLNLKLKFTLVICALLVLSTVALGWMVGLQVEESALRELKEKGEVVARGLADASVLGILTYSPDLLQAALDPLKKTDDVVYAGIADERGVVHAQHRMEEIGRVPDWTSGSVTRIGALIEEGGTGRLKSGAPVYFFSVPILTDPGASNGEELGMLLGEDLPSTPSSRVGSICIGLSGADLVQDLRDLRRGLMLATLAVLMVGVGIAILLVRLIVDPMKQLVHATRRIAQGDLDIILPVRGRDETGDLAKAFNRMTLNLRESRQALERSNAELESKVKERTQELEEAHDQLVQAEKMTVVGQLVSGVAHELNNPLAGVLGYAQLLLRKQPATEVERGLKKIEREAERCKRIVQNLLVFARKHKLRKDVTDINAVIESVLELRAYHLEVENVKVTKNLDPGLPHTMADTNQIQQVLMNIINNAQHAMASSGRPRELTLRTHHSAGRILIEVQDSGAGITPENLKKVFDPFFTTKEVGQGTGLGLSICYGIVDEHGGTIRVESRPAVGTTFTIDLPVQHAEGGAPVATAVEPELLGVRGGRILLVDDEPSILDVIGDTLRLDGHQVVVTTNGASALDKISQERFDVIVSDLKMPGMGGQELFQKLGELGGGLSHRVIFTTGDLASPETVAFLEQTGNPYLQKPFDLNIVRRTVQDLLLAQGGASSN